MAAPSSGRHLSGGSNVQRVIKEAGAVGIDVHVIARRELSAADPVQTGTG
jgi:hypothetical protein